MVEVHIALKDSEVIDEVNEIIEFTHKREMEVEGDARERRHLAHILALGVLYMKWMSQNPPAAQEQYLENCTRLYLGLKPAREK